MVVLSDVHLRAGSDWLGILDRMRGLWAGAATVIFNGDTMSKTLVADEAARVEIVERLTEMCAADGARAVLVTGNTDYALGGPRHVFLAEGGALVTHGDVILEQISPWHGGGGQITAARADALAEMPLERRGTLEGQLAAANEAVMRMRHMAPPRRRGEGTFTQRLGWYWRLLRRPLALWAVLDFWRRMPRLAAEFLALYADEARVMILGHAHWRGVWRVGDKWIVNTGSFEPPLARALVVSVTGTDVQVRKVVRSKGLYLPGRTVGRYDISRPATRPGRT